MTLLTSLLTATNFRNPFLRTLVPSVGAAFAIQSMFRSALLSRSSLLTHILAAVAIPSILAQSERFYDLSGSLTYLSVTALSLYLPTLRARAAAHLAGKLKPEWPSLIGALMGKGGVNGLNWRQVVLSTAVSIWATRRRFPTSSFHSFQGERLIYTQSEATSSKEFLPTGTTLASTK